MNDFEKYLKENKQKMDLTQVNPKIWDKIEERALSNSERSNGYWYLKLVASFAAVFLIGFVLWESQLTDDKVEIPVELFAEYGFEDNNVEETLEYKIDLISNTPFPVLYEDNFQQLYNQIKYLDEVYKRDVAYIKQKDYDENIAKEVLTYYKAKSDILDKIISEIQKINDNEKIYKITSEKATIAI